MMSHLIVLIVAGITATKLRNLTEYFAKLKEYFAKLKQYFGTFAICASDKCPLMTQLIKGRFGISGAFKTLALPKFACELFQHFCKFERISRCDKCPRLNTIRAAGSLLASQQQHNIRPSLPGGCTE